jgi:NADPH:quinone reductase-like Zn-dependent oxidoreductase
MKAVLCKQHGAPEMLTIEDVPSPQPKADDVVVAVHAAAVNFPDTLIIANKYQLKPALPFSPGGEVTGTIKAVGIGVSDFAPGDRVIAVCGWGGFAEEVVVPHTRVVHLQKGVPMDAAAALVLTYGTTHYALQERARLRPRRIAAGARRCGRHRLVGGDPTHLREHLGLTVAANRATRAAVGVQVGTTEPPAGSGLRSIASPAKIG